MHEPTLPQFQAADQPPDEEDDLPPGLCAQCRVNPSQPEFAAPLCVACRQGLINFPVPVWVQALGAVVVLVMAFSLVNYPSALQAGVAFERGQNAERRGDYELAVTEYRRAAKRYPGSIRALIRLTVAEFRAGHLKETVDLLGQLERHEIRAEEAVNELNGIVRELEKLAGPEQAPPEDRER